MSEGSTYFGRIEELIKERELRLRRKLTLDEEDEVKFQAMQELWIEASREIAEEERKASQ